MSCNDSRKRVTVALAFSMLMFCSLGGKYARAVVIAQYNPGRGRRWRHGWHHR